MASVGVTKEVVSHLVAYKKAPMKGAMRSGCMLVALLVMFVFSYDVLFDEA